MKTGHTSKQPQANNGRSYAIPRLPRHARPRNSRIISGGGIARPAFQPMLEAYFETKGRGEGFDAPIDVILPHQDVVQPDLVLVTDVGQISTRGIEGPPFLLVEVLSPATREHDRTAKAARYAALGVNHYWIVDPDAQQGECCRSAGVTFELVVQAQGPAVLSHPTGPDMDDSGSPFKAGGSLVTRPAPYLVRFIALTRMIVWRNWQRTSKRIPHMPLLI